MKKFLLLTLFWVAGLQIMLAQFNLVKDIYPNTGTPDATSNSSPGYITMLNGVAYFAATDDVHGNELWKSDGTANGTTLLKDLQVGNASSIPANLIVFNNAIYFTASDGLNGTELWKTDGTVDGTRMVKDINPGSSPSNPDRFYVYNNALYFRATSPNEGSELWKTDGTEAGTVLVKDILLGSSASSPNYFIEYNSKLYFAADGGAGIELWVTDGTSIGTVQVYDINTSSATASSSPQQFCVYNNKLYFQATNGNQTTVAPLQYGTEIWVYNGTTVERLTDINTLTGAANFNGNSTPTSLTVFNNKIYFSANNKTNGFELWETDGVVGGTTQMVLDIESGTTNSSPSYFYVYGSTLYFSAFTTAAGTELWKTDGTAANTILVKDIEVGGGNSNPLGFFSHNGTLYFIATTTANGQELYKTDGTDAGTVLFKEFNATGGASIFYLTQFDATHFVLAATNGLNGSELWMSDGTSGGTTMVKDIANGFSSAISKLTAGNTALFFTANDGVNGIELWKSTGTDAGTSLTVDINPGTTASTPNNLINVNGIVYFSATNGTTVNGVELWKSDGTPTGTVMVKDIQAGTSASSPSNLVDVNGTLFFSATNGTTNGIELWKSDGTIAGTAMVKDIRTGTGTRLSSSPANLTNVNGTLFFTATNGTATDLNGNELWKSDGTDAGTVMVKDISTGTANSTSSNLTNVNGTLYFTATNGTNGIELWKSDGTDAGTVMVKDIVSGTTGSTPSNLTNVNGTLYFTATDATNGTELWKSDGTDAGTVLVKDIVAGSGSPSITRMKAINGNLVFVATDATNGTELWKSNGTTEGTMLLKDFTASGSSAFWGSQLVYDNELYFIVNNELWKTNATSEGTLKVGTIGNGAFGSEMALLNDTMFFNAYSDLGQELWSYFIEPSAPVALDVTGLGTNGFTANWSSPSTSSVFFLDVATDTNFTNILPAYSNLNLGNVKTYTVTGLNPNTVYFYRIRRSFNGNTSANSNVVKVKVYQTITFDALANQGYGTADYNAGATASSGLVVTYTSSNTDVATIVDNKIHIVGLGYTTITALQTGNNFYAPATSVDQVLTIVKGDQTITFNPILDGGIGDPDFDPQAVASSGLAVTYTSSNTNVATIIDNKVHIVALGSTTITASQAGNGYYNAAPNVEQTLNVTSKASQSITFDALAEKTYGDMPYDLLATTSSGLTVSFASNNTQVAQVSGTTVYIMGAGTALITASQAGNDSYNPAPNVVNTLKVNKAVAQVMVHDSTLVYDGTAKTLRSTTEPQGLTLDFTYNGASQQPVEGGSYEVIATINNANYSGVDTGIMVISPAVQSITFTALTDKLYDDANFGLTATATSGLQVSFASSDTTVAVVNNGTVDIVGVGSTVITASQTGNRNYQAAADVTQTLNVLKASQTITFDALTDKTFGDNAFNLAATSTSGLEIKYNSSNESVATISGNSVTILSAGTTTITATQAGDDNYLAASDVQQTLTINKAAQTIDFGVLSAKTYGDSAFVISGISTSGLKVAFTSNNPEIAKVEGDTVTIVGGGTASIVASQAGDANYLPATDVVQELLVIKAAQTITFGTLTEKVYGTVPFELTGSSTSGLAIEYVSSNTTVAQVNGNVVTLVGVGTTTISATQPGNANYSAATAVAQVLTVIKGTAGIQISGLNVVYNGSAKPVTVVTQPAGLNYALTYDRLTAVPVNAGSYVVEVVINDANYAGTLTDTLTIAKAEQTIVFDAISSKTINDAPFALDAFSTAGLQVSYTSSNESVATILDNIVTILSAGTTNITAKQAGNNNYMAAADVTQELVVVTTDINDVAGNQVLVYPNPTNGVITIDLGTSNMTKSRVKLLNVAGKVVMETEIHNGFEKIYIENLNTGIYFMHIEIENGWAVKQVMICE